MDRKRRKISGEYPIQFYEGERLAGVDGIIGIGSGIGCHGLFSSKVSALKSHVERFYLGWFERQQSKYLQSSDSDLQTRIALFT
jgi:hypothetical protein